MYNSHMRMFHESITPGAAVRQASEGHWRFSIPAGEAGGYRVAQLDDYKGLPRRRFPHRPPFHIQLEGRASGEHLPGTWGFGLWNDPFSLTLGFGGGRYFPALPNAAWFFFASPPNYLSLRDDLPANGALAAAFRSPKLPFPLLSLGLPFLPLLAFRPAARWLRRAAGSFVRQDAAQLNLDPTAWHRFAFSWERSGLEFRVDGETVLSTVISPRGPLGLVLWIDNQYAALPPDGRPAFGTLSNPAAWIEVRGIEIGGEK